MERVNWSTTHIGDILRQYHITDNFLPLTGEENCCILLYSCSSKEMSSYIGLDVKAITGYNAEEFHERGIDFWFSLIHPEDQPQVSERIIEAHETLHTQYLSGQFAVPLNFRYRLKHPLGVYTRIKDSRLLLSKGNDGGVEHILFRIEPEERQDSGEWILDKLRREEKCFKMLELAVKVQQQTTPIPRLTAREKEILQHIAAGMSSKMIACECNISINTVETHRRHLLQKLGVRNSMELVKEASKVFAL